MNLRILGLLAVLPITLSQLACSSSEAAEEEGADEGALSADSILSAVIGEASRGSTLGKDFVTKRAKEKQSLTWAKSTESGALRCQLDASSIAGDALVRKLQACPVGTDADDLITPTVPSTLKAATWGGFMALLNGAGLLSPAFDHTGDDEAPRLRKKIIHSFGSVGKVELRINARSTFTGVLAPPAAGAELTRVPGVARYSAGGPEKLLGFLPGAGVKLFTTGGQSVDLHLLPPRHADGSPEAEAAKARPNYNVLAEPFSNEFAKAGEAGTAEKIFAKVHPTPLFLPIDHMGKRTVDGEVVSSPSTPKHLSFVPDPATSGAVDAYLRTHPGADYRIALAEATKNATEENPVVLYTVRAGLLAANRPADVEREYPAIGQFVATSAFVPSKWADRQIYTRHNRGCTAVTPDPRISSPGEAKVNAEPSLCSGGRSN